MSSASLAKRCAHQYTGEPSSAAGRRFAAGSSPIPAAIPELAALESQILIAFGRPFYESWFGTPAPTDAFALGAGQGRRRGGQQMHRPWGLLSVIPGARELQIELRADFLPEFINRVLPMGSAHDEISGVPGLRAKVFDTCVVLARPGRPGQVRLATTRSQWEHAAKVALRGVPVPNVLWQRYPEHCSAVEQGFQDQHGWVYDFGDDRHALISGLLRRPHVFDGKAKAEFWKLWTVADSVRIQWHGGEPHRIVIGRLLDAELDFGDALSSISSHCRCLDAQRQETYCCHAMTLTHSSGMTLILRRNPIRMIPLQPTI
ncbi:hypothetical protein ACSNOI_03375 [Actinomadura kijaniata]|uniref:hypothetical protein n=1 Tax=Actinomadura kijaniata TaxID=46161 RepID=UPI003F1C8775